MKFEYSAGYHVNNSKTEYRKTINLSSQNISIKTLFVVYLVVAVIMSIVSLFFVFIGLVKNRNNLWDPNILIGIIILGIILWAVIFYKYFSRRWKLYKETMEDIGQEDYISEFPSEHRPAIIAYLLQGQNTDGSDVTATLLDLVNRRYLIMNEEYILEDLLRGDKEIILSKNENIDFSQLLEYEKFLINWFINELGDGECIKTSCLKEKLKNDKKSGEKFLEWQRLLSTEYKNNLFETKNNKKQAGTIILLFLEVAALFIFNIFLPLAVILFFLIQYATIKLVFDISGVKLLTQEGKILTRKWRGFIRYITESTLIKEREMEAVVIYEKYLIYAVALGCADKVIKSMDRKYGWEFYAISK